MIMAPLSRGRHQSGNVNRVQVRGHRGHRHHLVQQKSPLHKDALPPSPLTTSNSCTNSSTTQSSNLQLSTTAQVTSPRTESHTSSLSDKEGGDEETKVTSSITNQSINNDSSAIQHVSKIESTESSLTPVKESQKEKSIKNEGGNKNETASEKESASKMKFGSKISKAFHNVMKNVKKSPRSATMEEKEISIPITNDTKDEEGSKDKISGNAKVKKDIVTGSNASIKLTQSEQKNEMKMSRRQRKNSSTSSLAAAMQAKAQKDDIGNYSSRQDYSISNSTPNKKITSRSEYGSNKVEKHEKELESDKKSSKYSLNKSSIVSSVAANTNDCTESYDDKTEKNRNSEKEGNNKTNSRKMNSKYGNYSSSPGAVGKKKVTEANLATKKESEEKRVTHSDENEKQHLSPDDNVEVGDRIKVFYIRETIYPAKVIQVQEPKNGEKWPRYRVHYDGWNKRYDEWIKRSRIAEFNSEKEKATTGGPPESTTEDSEPTSPPSTRKEASRKDSGMSTASSSSSSSRLDNNPLSSKKKLRKSDKESEILKDRSLGRNLKASKLATSNEKDSGSRAGTPSSLRGSRTNSPVSALKRQNSRGSMKKDTDESEPEAEREAEEIMSSDSTGGRKSSRLQKSNHTQPSNASGDDRSKRNDRRSDRKRAARDESETDDTDAIKDESVKDINKETSSQTKPKRGRKGNMKTVQDDSESEDNKSVSDVRKHSKNSEKSNTRSGGIKSTHGSIRSQRTPLKGLNSDQEEDPYDFKEPEPFDVDVKFETPRKQTSPLPSSSASQKFKDDESKKELIEGNQIESVYSSAAESSSSSSSKKANASNLSSLASSASSASDEGNFSEDEKPNVEKFSSEEDPLQMREEDPLGGMVGRTKRKEIVKEHRLNNAADHNEVESTIDVQEDINEDELCASLNKPLSGTSEVGKPLLPLPKKLQEVFPHLAAIRTTALPGNSPRGHASSTVGNSSANPSNSSTNTLSIPKSNSSQVPSQSLQTNSLHKTNTIHHQTSQGIAGRSICTPPIAKQKPSEISESISSKSLAGVNKQDLSNKDKNKIMPRRSRSRSPLQLSIVDENINESQTESNENVPQKKQRRKPTKPTSSELVGSESESENDNEEDIEADGDVDSNGEDTVIHKGRIRQQQQHHRKRNTGRVDSKKDNIRSSIIPPVNSSASSNDNSPSKPNNKHSPNVKNKNKSVTTSLTMKPLTNLSGIPPVSAIKRKRDIDAASETTESDEESLTRSKVTSSQHSTKRVAGSNDKMKRLKKEATSSSYITGDQDDLDLACGETIPGSPVHPSQNDLQNSSPEQFARETANQRLSASAVSNSPRINVPQNQLGNMSDKDLLQDLAKTNSRSQHSPTLHKGNSKQSSNRLEMPFASVPESVHSCSSNNTDELADATKITGGHSNIGKSNLSESANGHSKGAISGTISSKGKPYHRDGDIESLQGYSSTSQSPTHGDDSAGNSRSKSPPDQNDLQGDSSEVDMDSLSGRGAGSGADSSTWPGEIRNKASVKRKVAERNNVGVNILNMRERGSRSPATGSRSPIAHSSQVGKRKKRSRKTSLSTQGGLRGRKRHGSGRNGISNREDDSDDEDDGIIETRQHNDSRQSTRVSSLGSLDNDALAALSQRSPRTSKFNFYVKFGKFKQNIKIVLLT